MLGIGISKTASINATQFIKALPDGTTPSHLLRIPADSLCIFEVRSALGTRARSSVAPRTRTHFARQYGVSAPLSPQISRFYVYFEVVAYDSSPQCPRTQLGSHPEMSSRAIYRIAGHASTSRPLISTMGGLKSKFIVSRWQKTCILYASLYCKQLLI
jgi:hypothetical protein